MLSIGIVVGLLGYSLVFYGQQMWVGCSTNSLLDIMWPGGQKFVPCAPTATPVAPNATVTGTGGTSGAGAPGLPGSQTQIQSLSQSAIYALIQPMLAAGDSLSKINSYLKSKNYPTITQSQYTSDQKTLLGNSA